MKQYHPAEISPGAQPSRRQVPESHPPKICRNTHDTLLGRLSCSSRCPSTNRLDHTDRWRSAEPAGRSGTEIVSSARPGPRGSSGGNKPRRSFDLNKRIGHGKRLELALWSDTTSPTSTSSSQTSAAPARPRPSAPADRDPPEASVPSHQCAVDSSWRRRSLPPSRMPLDQTPKRGKVPLRGTGAGPTPPHPRGSSPSTPPMALSTTLMTGAGVHGGPRALGGADATQTRGLGMILKGGSPTTPLARHFRLLSCFPGFHPAHQQIDDADPRPGNRSRAHPQPPCRLPSRCPRLGCARSRPSPVSTQPLLALTDTLSPCPACPRPRSSPPAPTRTAAAPSSRSTGPSPPLPPSSSSCASTPSTSSGERCGGTTTSS